LGEDENPQEGEKELVEFAVSMNTSALFFMSQSLFTYHSRAEMFPQ